MRRKAMRKVAAFIIMAALIVGNNLLASARMINVIGKEGNKEQALGNSDFIIDENGILTKYQGQGGDIVIPEGATSIGFVAFSGCSGLTSVTIPSSVTNIENGAFSDCNGLTNVTVDKANPIYDSREL